jgi:serine/threonine protein kinase
MFRYEPVRLLGKGGFGEVYRAHDRETGSDVALKILASDVPVEALLRFQREATLLASLSHPAIVPITDAGETPDGQRYYAMPYIAGAITLGDWIQAWYARTPHPPPRAILLELIAPIAAALDHLHARPVLHRDIKPSNVLVLPTGRPVLIDFGLAGFVHSALTKTGMVVGTMAYMPPEQARSEEVGPPADLYQLGLLLYEIAAGRRACEDLMMYLRGVAQGQRAFPPPSARNPMVGRALEDVILKATDPDPAHRYASGAALVEAVRSVPETAWYADDAVSQDTSAFTLEEVRSAALAKSIQSPESGVRSPESPRPRRTGRTKKAPHAGVSPPTVPSSPARRLGAALGAAGALLALVAAVLLVTSPTPPVLGALQTAPGLGSLIVTFSCTPARPASLEATTATGARTLHAPAAASHRFVVRDLPPGERVRLRAVIEGARGPALEVALPAAPIEITSVAFGADALEVNLRSDLGLRCALRVPTGAGPLTVGGTWEGTTHRLEVPLARFPFAARWTAELARGDERLELPLRLPAKARAAHVSYVVAWMETKEREVSKYLFETAQKMNGMRMGELLRSAVPRLPPAWLLDELGGREGVLDDAELDAATKDRFGRLIGRLEALDGLMELCRVPHLYPHERLYGARIRPARASAMTTATVVPVELDFVDEKVPFHVVAEHVTAEEIDKLRELARTLRGHDAVVVPGAVGRFTLGKLPRGARVELAARLAIPGGRALHVELNGREVRLLRPDRAAPLDTPAAYHAGVDPAFLREGVNDVVLRVPSMPPGFETAFGLSDIRVDPPGLTLRIGN